MSLAPCRLTPNCADGVANVKARRPGLNTNTDTTDAATQYYDYDVIDGSGNDIGSVDNVWVDDATDALEFVGVKTGWIFGQTHVIPIENAQIDDANQTITVPYSEDQIKNAPNFPSDATLSAADEDQIYSYYGMDRSTQESPTGYAAGGQTGTTTTQTTQTTGSYGQTDLPSEPTEVDMTTSEEQVQVGKRTVQAGDVRLRKVVRTEHQDVPVELRREEVNIERVPAGDATVPDDAFEEQEIDIPVMEEQPVVGKQTVVTGGVRVTKDVETQTQTVGADVRSTDVEVEGDDDLDDDTNND